MVAPEKQPEQTDQMGGRTALWACAAPARTCLDGGEAATICRFSQASFRAMGPVELSKVLNFLALQHSPLSQLSALAEKMALDFIYLSCPPVVQT